MVPRSDNSNKWSFLVHVIYIRTFTNALKIVARSLDSFSEARSVSHM